MPVIAPTPTTPGYSLVVFDAKGREVAESDGSAMSETVAARIAVDGVTDVVLLCHGWLDALVDAESTYAGWLETAHSLPWPGPVPPLVVAAHWPSAPLAKGEPPDVPAALEAQLADGGLRKTLADAGVSVMDFLSFWTMRERAITLGSAPTGLARLVARMFAAGGAAGIRLHLVGHSLGCVALSGALTSTRRATGPHVATFFLAQAAESSWAFSASVPFFTGGTGRYHAVVADHLVDGALIATNSTHDAALGRWYPLGMEVVLQRSYAVATPGAGAGAALPGEPAVLPGEPAVLPGEPAAVLPRQPAALPGEPDRTAALGAHGFGFDPPLATVHALPALTPGATSFTLAAGEQYAIDASALVASHTDVDHIELARLFYAAVALTQVR